MDMHDAADEDIAVLVQQGSAESFGELMRRYESKLTRYGATYLSSPETVTDLVQDVFIKTYQNMQSFDRTQRFSPWIYRIAHNVFVNELRQRQRRAVTLPGMDTFFSNIMAPEKADDMAESSLIRTMLDRGLELLPPAQREVLVLYYLEELSYKEISDILAVPVNTVGVRLTRAKQALKKAYASLGITYGF